MFATANNSHSEPTEPTQNPLVDSLQARTTDLLHDEHLVSDLDIGQLLRDEHHGGVLQHSAHALVEYGATNVRIDTA